MYGELECELRVGASWEKPLRVGEFASSSRTRNHPYPGLALIFAEDPPKDQLARLLELEIPTFLEAADRMLGRTKGNFFLGDEVGRNRHQVCVCAGAAGASTVLSAQMTYADVVVADLLVRLQDEFDAELKLMGGDAGERAKKVRTEHPGLVELAARYHGRGGVLQKKQLQKMVFFFNFRVTENPGIKKYLEARKRAHG